MSTKKTTTAAAITLAVAGLALVGPGRAAAEPGSPCAQGRPCASSPTCPTDEVAVPAGPHAQAVPAPGNSARQCATTVTITPKPGIVEAQPARVGS